MRDLRWVETDLPGVFDLVNEAGERRGYVMPASGGTRGYVMLPGRKKYQRHARFLAISDHPTEADARAWVEGEVRGRAIVKRGGGDAA